MQGDLGLSDAVYGFGAGIFFIGYFLFEVTSNLILQRVGALLWIARIMVVWGLVSAATLLVRSPLQFYALRFALGVAEAGFFPGIILYLTFWYPRAYRARMVAAFMTAIALSGVVGGPVSGWILARLDGGAGLVDVDHERDETARAAVVLADDGGGIGQAIAVQVAKGDEAAQGDGDGIVGIGGLYAMDGYWRQFQLPDSFDVAKARAEVRNGVLTLHLPKAEAAKPLKIAIATQH